MRSGGIFLQEQILLTEEGSEQATHFILLTCRFFYKEVHGYLGMLVGQTRELLYTELDSRHIEVHNSLLRSTAAFQGVS